MVGRTHDRVSFNTATVNDCVVYFYVNLRGILSGMKIDWNRIKTQELTL